MLFSLTLFHVWVLQAVCIRILKNTYRNYFIWKNEEVALSLCIYRDRSTYFSQGLIKMLKLLLSAQKKTHIFIDFVIWKCLLIFIVHYNVLNFISFTTFKIQLTFSQYFCCLRIQNLKYSGPFIFYFCLYCKT